MKYITLAKFWMPKIYDKIVRYYEYLINRSSLVKKGYRKIVEGLKPGSILDIGCGPGTLLEKEIENAI